jgi:hypothetical protein
MTLFEYMSVAMSLIVALTFAEGLRGLRSALDPERRYWVHAAWLFLKLYNPILFWWYTWGFRDIPDYWNLGTYTMSLVTPSIMYLQVYSLVSDRPYKVTNWREHFFSQRRWFFGLNIMLGILVILVWSNLLTPAPARLVPVAGYGLITALSVIGFITDNPKIHTVIVTLSIGFNIIYVVGATFSPLVL